MLMPAGRRVPAGRFIPAPVSRPMLTGMPVPMPDGSTPPAMPSCGSPGVAAASACCNAVTPAATDDCWFRSCCGAGGSSGLKEFAVKFGGCRSGGGCTISGRILLAMSCCRSADESCGGGGVGIFDASARPKSLCRFPADNTLGGGGGGGGGFTSVRGGGAAGGGGASCGRDGVGREGVGAGVGGPSDHLLFLGAGAGAGAGACPAGCGAAAGCVAAAVCAGGGSSDGGLGFISPKLASARGSAVAGGGASSAVLLGGSASLIREWKGLSITCCVGLMGGGLRAASGILRPSSAALRPAAAFGAPPSWAGGWPSSAALLPGSAGLAPSPGGKVPFCGGAADPSSVFACPASAALEASFGSQRLVARPPVSAPAASSGAAPLSPPASLVPFALLSSLGGPFVSAAAASPLALASWLEALGTSMVPWASRGTSPGAPGLPLPPSNERIVSNTLWSLSFAFSAS
mmetsp:Transcript_63942/g.180027  ORF Transcript_63942/g.180027 Transcript_63942/m.180027 type:complete len:461 (-) Transcript_63942:503-1885(-)